MAPHSSTLAWKIPGTEEPGGLQFMGSQRVRLDRLTNTLPTMITCLIFVVVVEVYLRLIYNVLVSGAQHNDSEREIYMCIMLLLLLLSHFSRVRLCATP